MTQVNPFAPQQSADQQPQQTQPTSEQTQQQQPQAQQQVAQPQQQAAPTQQTQPMGTMPATMPQQQAMPVATMPQQGAAQARAGVDDVSLDDDIKFHTLEKFPKMKANEVARIALLVFNENNAPSLKKVDYFYDKAQNAIWNVPKTPQVLQACVQKYGEPKIKFGGIIIKYETDMYGNVLPSGNYQLLAWTFSKDKWPTLKSLHNMWGLHNHDLILTCKEAEFQKIDIQPAPQCLFRANPEFAAQVIAQATTLHNQFLPQLMGRVLTDQEIMALVNGMPAQQGAVPGAMPAGMPAGGSVNPFAAGAGVGAPAQAALAAPQTVPGANFADMVASR